MPDEFLPRNFLVGSGHDVEIYLEPTGERCKILVDGMEIRQLVELRLNAPIDDVVSIEIKLYPSSVRIHGQPEKLVLLERIGTARCLVGGEAETDAS